MDVSVEAMAVFAALVGLSQGLVRVVERLIDRQKTGTGQTLSDGKLHRELYSKVSDLWEWHNHDMPNDPGVKVWWVTSLRSSVENLQASIDKLADSIEAK